MSVQAISWAFSQPIRPASRKFVLVALANFSGSEDSLCFPSTQTLCEHTSLDRKTVIECLDDLEKEGYILDTGKRRGVTSQVKVYKLKDSQKRNHSENGTVPVLDSKAPVFPIKGSQNSLKDSQKRDTDPVVTVQNEPYSNQQGVSSSEKPPIFVLQERLNALMKRTPGSRWSYEEEYSLADVAKRPDCLSELSEVEGWFKKPDAQFLPQSLSSLLTKWTGHLDRARKHDETIKRNTPKRFDASAGTSNAGVAASYANAPQIIRGTGRRS